MRFNVHRSKAELHDHMSLPSTITFFVPPCHNLTPLLPHIHSFHLIGADYEDTTQSGIPVTLLGNSALFEMAEPLNPASLCSIIRKSIQPETGLKDEYDGLACLAHACMLSTGFKFIELGEAEKAQQSITASELSSLPAAWNTSNSSMYAFRYTHDQSSMEFVIRVSRMGRRTMIFGIAVDDDKTCSFDIATQDFTSENFYPWKPEENAEALTNGYISMSRMKDFSSRFKLNVLQKLIPGLNKEGYTEESTSATTQSSRAQATNDPDSSLREDRRPAPGYDPLRNPARPNPRPSDWPPEFEDEYEMQGSRSGPRFPGGIGGIGADDLRPPGIDAMNPFSRRSGGHRGMHPTPEDIMFPDQGYGTPTFPSPGMPPAGARYDPVFPGDRNGLGGRGGRSLGRGGFNQLGSPGGPMDSEAHDSMFS